MDLKQRMGGKLPEIEIEGTMFFVDIRLRELRADFRLMSRIKLDQCELAPDGESYRFAYNKTTKQMVNIGSRISEWPKDVVIVEIPGELKLDPYAVARHYGVDPVQFVKSNPIEKELKAKTIPLSETPFLTLMEKNKKQQQKLIHKPARDLTQKNKGNRIR